MKAQTAIKTINLTKKFGNFTAVDNLNLEVFKGEVFGFLGPNGAGKTTSINMMCGITKPSSGEVFFNGKNLKDNAGLTGLCPQENIIWPQLTCIEQLEFMGEMYGMKRISARRNGDELLDKMGLSDKRKQKASDLSGGMQRRLSICLALIHNPEIVIFDEPEAGLDPQSRILVREFIKQTGKDRTVILTTHNMDEAERLADRIAIVDKGKLLLLDTPDAMKQSIGDGDILEIIIPESDKNKLKGLEDKLEQISPDYKISGKALTIRSRKIVSLIPDIASFLTGEGIKAEEMKIRQNSLEDVFIYLTGRKLRD